MKRALIMIWFTIYFVNLYTLFTSEVNWISILIVFGGLVYLMLLAFVYQRLLEE